MKFIKVLIFLLISASSYGQFYTNINTSIYWKQPSGFDKVFIGNDTFQTTDNSKRWIAIKNAVMYFHDGTKWTAISGGGGGGGSYTLPTASPTVLGGIKYSTDFYLNTLAQLAIDTSKRNLWNQVALLPFYAKIDSVKKWLNDTANAHDYVFGSDFTVTGRNVSVNFPAQLTDTYGSSIWPGLTDKPAIWDAKTDYSEFLDSINSLRAIRRDSIFFNRADFLGSGTSLSPISLASNTDVSSTETGLITPGYVTWSGTGYTYDVTPAIYRVNGLYYTSAAGSVTLDAADGALNRIDAVVVDTFGVVSKITGVAASNPVAPIPNPSSQVLLTNITVTPGSSAPSTLNTIVYNEEGNGEYTGSSSGVTSNTANTTFPFSGAKSDNIGAWASGSTVTFTNGTTASATSYTYLKFFIRLKGVVQNATSISVIFYNGTTPVSKLVSIVNYGINKSLVGSYQNVSVPFSVFGFTSNQFNKIQFRFGGPDGPGCYLDFIQLQNSAVTETGSNALTDVFLKSDSLFKTVGGNSLFVGKVGGSGGVATDTTSLSNRINAKLNISDAATTYFPLTGGTLTGIGGNGYVGFNPQSATPSTPTSGFRLFATNPGAFAWITSQGYARELRVRAQTQNNIYYLQDKSYTLADSSDVAGKLNINDTANMLNGYARKTNTVTVNGITQNLGNNPSFTVSGGSSGNKNPTNVVTLYNSGTLALTNSGVVVPKLKQRLLNTDYTDTASAYRFVGDFSEGITSGDVVEMRVLDMDNNYMAGGITTVPFRSSSRALLDASSNAFNGEASVNGITFSSSNNSIAGSAFGQSVAFDNSTTYASINLQSGVNVNSRNELNISAGGTIECFFSATRNSTHNEALISKWDDNATATIGNYILYKNTSNKVAFSWKNSTGASTTTVSSTTSIVLGTTYHIAITFTGGVVKLYLNGVLEGTSAGGATISNTTTANFRIGKSDEPGNTFNDFSGSIDEVRVSNTARYTAAFTPTTAPFTSDANTIALYHLDGFSTANTYDTYATVKVACPFTALPSVLTYAQIKVYNQTAPAAATRGFLYNVRLELK